MKLFTLDELKRLVEEFEKMEGVDVKVGIGEIWIDDSPKGFKERGFCCKCIELKEKDDKLSIYLFSEDDLKLEKVLKILLMK